MLALAPDVAAHDWLTTLRLCDADLQDPAAFDAVVEAALARRLCALQLRDCCLSPASVPALVRLLAGNTLTRLAISSSRRVQLLLDEPAATLLGDVLRANTSLTSLKLTSLRLWRSSAAAVTLLAALVGHPRLRAIDLSGNSVHNVKADAGAVLGALVAANAPALRQLNISFSQLGNAGMGPLVEALRHNTHLTKLDCTYNLMSEAFARDRLLPKYEKTPRCARSSWSRRPGTGGNASPKARERLLRSWRRARSSRERDVLETACGARGAARHRLTGWQDTPALLVS
jgi:hypothetical protein